MKRISFLLVVLLFTFSYISTARDTISPTQPLFDNETLVSSGGHFAIGFFTPTNSGNRYLGIWYNKIAIQTIVWVANREDPLTNSTGLLSVTSDGALTITDESLKVVWSVNTTGLTRPVAQLLDTGNFVAKEDNTESYAWQGFDYPTDTQLPGMKVGVDRSTGLNRTLTSWKSENDPSPGAYYGFMDTDGNPEIYLCTGSEKIWRSGPWNGVQLSGVPDPTSYGEFSFSFVNNTQQVTYSYDIINQSVVSMVVIGRSGVIQRLAWQSEIHQWKQVWYAPKDPCDLFGHCGPYGLCDANNSQVCECLLQTEFMPKNDVNWAVGERSEGCVRKTALDCKQDGTDRFVTLSNVKLPESANSMVLSLSLDVCGETCLENCSCTAYASSSGGCIIWLSELDDIRSYVGSGQDLYIRVAADEGSLPPSPTLSQKGNSKKGKYKIPAIIAGLLLGTLILSCACCVLLKRKRRGRDILLGATNVFNDNSNGSDRGKDLDLPLFQFSTIAIATDNFSYRNKLGQGGFGPVYKGKLGEHQEIAVKRLAKTSQQGTEEFKNEVMLIAKLQNRNLVRLLGCCAQGEERMLIYEYMPNKSLDTFLFVKEKAALLDWPTRYKIIEGISRGLLYLHHDSRYRIIHRDLKASNILLDEKMDPKISDFGMARLFGGDKTDFNTRKVVGTYGYMSPEYAMEGIFSLKSDVFSFGVLLLEIVCGRKNRGTYEISPHLNLVAHAWNLWNEGKSLELVDESIKTSPMNDAVKCIKIGLLCVQEHPEDRPLMSSVIVMLGTDIASLPQPKQPGFIGRISPFELDHIADKHNLFTTNELTVSLDCR